MSHIISLHVPESICGQVQLGKCICYDEIESILLKITARLSGVEFLGNEIGGGKIVLIWEASDPRLLLRKIQKSLFQWTPQADAISVSVWSSFADGEREVSFNLAEHEDRLMGWLGERKTPAQRRRARRPQEGDYYAIPLLDGRWGYARCLAFRMGMGDIVHILAKITDEPIALRELIDSQPLFPPVYTTVAWSIANAAWRFIGNSPPVEPWSMPPQRFSYSADREKAPGEYGDWCLHYGERVDRIGKLPEEMRSFEYYTAWMPEDLARRIMTGENPYSAYL